MRGLRCAERVALRREEDTLRREEDTLQAPGGQEGRGMGMVAPPLAGGKEITLCPGTDPWGLADCKVAQLVL